MLCKASARCWVAAGHLWLVMGVSAIHCPLCSWLLHATRSKREMIEGKMGRCIYCCRAKRGGASLAAVTTSIPMVLACRRALVQLFICSTSYNTSTSMQPMVACGLACDSWQRDSRLVMQYQVSNKQQAVQVAEQQQT